MPPPIAKAGEIGRNKVEVIMEVIIRSLEEREMELIEEGDFRIIAYGREVTVDRILRNFERILRNFEGFVAGSSYCSLSGSDLSAVRCLNLFVDTGLINVKGRSLPARANPTLFPFIDDPTLLECNDAGINANPERQHITKAARTQRSLILEQL